jgi:lipoate-protein ligase A
MSQGFPVERVRGDAGVFHAASPDGDAGRSATWFDVDRPALVLGSAQRAAVVDVDACVRHGVDVVQRRSGGGAVLMMPGEMLWLDVVVPRGDPLWHDDIGRAMWWLGEVWAEALAEVEPPGGPGAAVHHGPVLHTPWSGLVCWDGVGAGEVMVAGAKAVGISQRRTRHWLRLQSSIHLAWRPELLADVLAEPRPSVGELRSPHLTTAPPDALVDAVSRALQRR